MRIIYENPFIICADTESLLQKIDTCHSNPEKTWTTKINKHTGSGYSLFLYYLFDEIKNNHDCFTGKDCIKRSAEDLKKQGNKQKIFNKQTIFAIYTKTTLVLIMKNTKSQISLPLHIT